MVISGKVDPGPQWKTMLCGILMAVKINALRVPPDSKIIVLHVIGVRSHAEGITDWPQLCYWLRLLLWKDLEKLEIVLTGFFEDENIQVNLNDIDAQNEWIEKCMKKDAVLDIKVFTGSWHDRFNQSTPVDAAILLNPAFQSQLATWSETLLALKCVQSNKVDGESNSVPLVVTGETYWGREETYLNSIDVQMYEPILEDFGFCLPLRFALNPFAQLWYKKPEMEHPILNAHSGVNGFFLVAVGDPEVQPFPTDQIHSRNTLKRAEIQLQMEKFYDRSEFVVESWEKTLEDLKSGEYVHPLHTDIKDIDEHMQKHFITYVF